MRDSSESMVRASGISALALLLGCISISCAQAEQPEAVTIAEGSAGKVPWSISVYRQGDSRCVVGKAHGPGVWTNRLSCEPEEGKSSWGGPVVVPTSESISQGAVLFFFVKKPVGWLNVKVAKTDGDGSRWLRIPATRVPSALVALAGFDQGFSMALAEVRGVREFGGGICMQRVAVFNPAGRLIERSPPIFCGPPRQP